MKRKSLVTALAAVMSASVLLTACGQTSSTTSGNDEKKTDLTKATSTVIKATDTSKLPASAKARKDTMVIGMQSPDAGNLIPYLSDSSYNYYLCEMLYSSLGSIADDGTPVPGMASWNVSSDGLTYTFKIKDGAKYSNGTPVKADDVKFTFEYLLDPSYKGKMFDPTTTYIKGWEAFNKGTSKDLEGVKVVDDKTVKITLEQKNATAIYTLASTLIMSKDYFGKNYAPGNDAAVDALQNAPVGAGAWVLKSKKDGQEYDFDANDKYWGGAPKIKHILIKSVTDDTAIQEIKTGGVDMIEASSTVCSEENVSELTDAGFINMRINPTWGYGLLYINNKNPMFSDVKVRRALAYGLDRANIDKAAYGKYAQVINQPLPVVSWAYDASGITNYKYDPDKANKLLDEAGWKKGSDGIRTKDGKKFQIHFLQSTGNTVADKFVAVAKENLKKIGIDFVAEPMEFKQVLAKTTSHDFEMTFMATGFTTADPDQSASFKTNGIQNYQQYSNKNIDDLSNQELKELDKTKRKAVFKKLYKQLSDDMPIIPLYERNDMYPISSKITGIEPTTFKDFTNYLSKAEIK
ncbi:MULTISPECIES: ABC transporter substrate-binding protein [Clostridium]|uniref:ABC transporter substrate-binding protein n=1 Tax=Clostridium TaxID=1485 RepID=UPI00069DCA37|nr:MULTISPECIES: ABC transporter substrate-binding protein [Clostridium]KOF55994.1 hypothetical protein AGR56_03130 [Clostridium sp. DMHC 10]MCD2345411.1 ABC transporter substrate-binding protein [Clostridium guangxiense]